MTKPLVVNGEVWGTAFATLDPATEIGRSWREARRLLSVTALALGGLCLAVYAALARALRPTHAIRSGLERLAANDLSARLPSFDLAELSAVSDVFNALAQKLEATLAERSALTRKLIAVQDDERRRLARELHDEFGQSLTAIAAQAAAAAISAELGVSRRLGRVPQHLAHDSGNDGDAARSAGAPAPARCRGTGAGSEPESLVASWNGFEKGRMRFEIAIEGNPDDLPPSVCANLYRVAQEAITNSAKHAQARCVRLRLEARRADIVLSVEDDGETAYGAPAQKAGMGLLGMQERVVSLRGTLRFERRASGGARLVATIPK